MLLSQDGIRGKPALFLASHRLIFCTSHCCALTYICPPFLAHPARMLTCSLISHTNVVVPVSVPALSLHQTASEKKRKAQPQPCMLSWHPPGIKCSPCRSPLSLYSRLLPQGSPVALSPRGATAALGALSHCCWDGSDCPAVLCLHTHSLSPSGTPLSCRDSSPTFCRRRIHTRRRLALFSIKQALVFHLRHCLMKCDLLFPLSNSFPK